MTGTLHLVGTPIGNLGDMTQRAVETLRAVDRIYAEDTRRTRVLLSALGITGKAISSLHAHSSDRTVATALEILQEGRDIALVTDAGMPSISDPGGALVRAARMAGMPITAAPGPSAVTTAIALSGLVEGPFLFLGFLPRKGRSRRESLQRVVASDVPVVFFESPQRAADTLNELAELHPEREAAVCRELTKRFEEICTGTLGELAVHREPWRGELTLVVAASSEPAAVQVTASDLDEHIAELIAQGHSVKDIVRQLGRAQPSLPKRALYARAQALADRASPLEHDAAHLEQDAAHLEHDADPLDESNEPRGADPPPS
jgi:16S rRNA (cytidine1402-2'-O)-methyltransferase